MPTVEERIESRSGSLSSADYTFFPYALLVGSGGGSGSSGAEEQPGGGVLVNLTPLELLAIQGAQGAVLAASSGSSGGSGSSCPTTGEGFLFTQTGRYVRKFHVYTSHCEPLLDARTSRDAVGIPLLGDPFPTDPYSLAVSKTADSEPDDPTVWYVTVEYDRTGNPLLEPWGIDWDFTTFTKAATKDISNVPIRNAARKPFDPPAEMDTRRFTLTLSRNVHSWSLASALQYADAINSGTVVIADYTFPARTLKCNGWKATAFDHLGRRFWKETIVVEHNPDTWLLSVANVGYMDINGRPFTQEGFVSESPIPLDSDGIFKNPGDDLSFIDFQVYPERDFCTLRLNYGG
jgi:hypothetical protein